MKYPKFWFAVWIAMILCVMVGSMAPSRDIPIDMAHGTDKAVHFLGYFVLGAFALMLFRKKRALLFALAFLVVLGGCIEIAQGFLTRSRSAELLDFTVNSLGILAALVLRRTPVSRLLETLEDRFARGTDGRA